MPHKCTTSDKGTYSGRFELRATPGQLDAWRAHSAILGETLAEFLRRAADEQIVRDRVADRSRAARAACKHGVFPDWEK